MERYPHPLMSLGLVAGVLGGALGLGNSLSKIIKSDEKTRKELYSTQLRSNLNVEGAIESKDVNGDGLADLIVRYKNLSGQNEGMVFYGTKDGKYQTVEQIKAKLQSDEERTIKEKYSEKPVQEKK